MDASSNHLSSVIWKSPLQTVPRTTSQMVLCDNPSAALGYEISGCIVRLFTYMSNIYKNKEDAHKNE